jgi:hypothetical protein
MPRTPQYELHPIELTALPPAPTEVPLTSVGVRSVRNNLVQVVLRLSRIEAPGVAALLQGTKRSGMRSGNVQWNRANRELTVEVQCKDSWEVRNAIHAATAFVYMLLTRVRIHFGTAGAETDEASPANTGRPQSDERTAHRPRPDRRQSPALAHS